MDEWTKEKLLRVSRTGIGLFFLFALMGFILAGSGHGILGAINFIIAFFMIATAIDASSDAQKLHNALKNKCKHCGKDI